MDQQAAVKSGSVDVLIGFKGKAPRAAIESAGGMVKRRYDHIPVVLASIPDAARRGLAKRQDVDFVEDNVTRHFCGQVLDWGIDRVDAEVVHAAGNGGAGVNVCILDSGGDMDHPDLAFAGGFSVVTEPGDWDDTNGHGSHCSGIVAAQDNDIGVVGVAPDCNLYMVRINKSGLIRESDILAGIDWVIGTHQDADPDNDIRIVSMSWGGSFDSAAETVALQTCYDLGMLLLGAAGNEEGAIIFPARLPIVIAVTASNSTDGPASFTNFGPEAEIMAPGRSIYSTYKRGRYRTMSGTSMSCPMAAGVAAVAWSANPTAG
ncbi:MAG: S8 family peptidase, partial [Acidobacteriota bacterium]